MLYFLILLKLYKNTELTVYPKQAHEQKQFWFYQHEGMSKI